jgi:hypothetical protein
MLRLAASALAAVLACASGVARAQVSQGATPIYHGLLFMRPSHGSIDPETGSAEVKARRWRLVLTPDSDGIYPDLEPVVVAIGENTFMLPAGTLHASRRGRVFSYRALRTDTQAFRSFRIRRRRDGSYAVRFVVRGVDLSKLVLQDPLCLPTAVIVGDDDGFSGVTYSRPGFESRRLLIPSKCAVDSWPWT